MLPSLFIGHGAPNIIFQNNEYTEFLRNYTKTINKPKAIVIFSAHWESGIQAIGASENYDMIYDFYGFEEKLYTIQYKTGSNKDLVLKIQDLLRTNGISSNLDYKRGIDHGAWTVLKLIYPNIDIPVINMSVNIKLSNEEQYNIGKALEVLKKEDVLIICSGGIVHNLSMLNYTSENNINSWAYDFNTWIKDKLYKWNLTQLFNYEKMAPYSKRAVPRSEHFIPLLIAMGAGNTNKSPNLLKSIYQYGNLSLDFWEFK